MKFNFLNTELMILGTFLSPNMNLDGLFVIIAIIMLGLPFILTVIGFSLLKKNKKAAKTLFILAAVYVIVSLGICGSMMV